MKSNLVLFGAVALGFIAQIASAGWNIQLAWPLGIFLFAMLEHINHYHYQLMYETSASVRYVLRNRRLRKASLGMILLVILLMPLANACEEQTDMASIKHEHCEESNNLENTFCMSRELEESNRRLNIVYKTLTEALVRPQGLQKAQVAWTVFRDAHCGFDKEAMQGGSGYNFSLNLCLMQMTEQRIVALESVMPCNGCVEFKEKFYSMEEGFRFPERKRIPASGKP